VAMAARFHGAREDDHGVGRVAAAGDVGADVGVGMLLIFADGAPRSFSASSLRPLISSLRRRRGGSSQRRRS